LQTALQDPYSGNPDSNDGIPITFTANNKTGSFSNPSAVTGSTGTAVPLHSAAESRDRHDYASSPGYASATFVVTSTSTGQTGQTSRYHSGSGQRRQWQQLHRSRHCQFGLTVAYTSSGSCSNSGATYTCQRHRNLLVIANQAGNSSYALRTGHDTVLQLPWARPSRSPFRLRRVLPTAELHRSSHCQFGLTVAYTSSGSCSNAGATYTMTSGTGTCSSSPIKRQRQLCRCATGYRDVNAASGSQTITFTTPAPTSAANGSNFTVAATASSG